MAICNYYEKGDNRPYPFAKVSVRKIHEMDTKGVDSVYLPPQSSKAVFMNTVKKSRHTESTLSRISLFENTGSVLFLLDFYRDFNGPWNFLGLKSPTLVLVYELLAFTWQ
jgi:hypothetical protein